MTQLEQMQEQLNNLTELSNNTFALVNQLLSSSNFVPFKPTKAYMLYEWLEEWYNTYKVPNLKPSSLKSIRFCIDKHIKKNIDNKLLIELNGLDIQKALNRINSSRMKKYTYDTYNNSLKQALRLRYIQNNIMFEVESVKHKRKQGNALTVKEQIDFLNKIKDNSMFKLYKFYLLSGCRKSEALSIRFTDINYQNNTLTIHGTKTEKSFRTIPLFSELKTLLKSIPVKGEFIFNHTANAVKCNFDRIKEKYNFKFRIHDLRHTFATRCVESGISIKTVQKWLGHSKLDTTANIYTHIQGAFEVEESHKFNPKI